jgi:DNA-binding NtrC family response regulator
MKGRILLIDDDELLLEFMDEHLSMNGYKTIPFSSPADAKNFLKEDGGKNIDLTITDVKMNEITGDEIHSYIRSNHPEIGVILITGFGNINHSVNAMRKGAFDYITKPFKANEMILRVNRFFEKKGELPNTGSPKVNENLQENRSVNENHIKKLNGEQNLDELKFIGEDPGIKKLMQILPKIAGSDAPILLQGESGTGKEVFAHQIHKFSNRNHKAYIKINCANLPSELVESTLFGHLKGSFTGAISDRKGAFDEADGGTLLLDEITEIDINVQAKLLRVLQEKEYYRIGSQKPIKTDVRIIATSNRNIAQSITDGDFREDLYYRLNVFPIKIPPLRERRSDIPLLLDFFVTRYVSLYQLGEKKISDQLMEFFKEHEWRGNVRELENKIHRGVILSHGSDTIKKEHIENNLFSNVDEELSREVLTDLPLMSIEDMELQLIKKTLEHTRGNQKRAAELLGITDRTIRNKLKNIEL